jgi:hypothetical protein
MAHHGRGRSWARRSPWLPPRPGLPAGRLAALHRGAVDYSRTHLKPEIPVVGDYGIPLRDEIEVENSPGI